MEEWKSTERGYFVSSFGRIKNASGKILKQYKNKSGYMLISLSEKGTSHTYQVHRLVAKAFIPNPHNYECVDHKNSIRDDNRSDNLEWVTIRENNLRIYKRGNRTNAGEQNPYAILTNNQVNEIRLRYIKKYKKVPHSWRSNKIELANEYGVSKSTIKDIVGYQSFKF